MNLLYLLAQVPQAAWIGFVISVVLPGASAALVRAHWDSSITGFCTLGLSTATGFFTEWAHAGSTFHWQMAAALSLAYWLVAALTQSKILSGTQFESWLVALGSKLKTEMNDLYPDDDLEEPSDPTLEFQGSGPEDATTAGQVASDSQIAAPPTTS